MDALNLVVVAAFGEEAKIARHAVHDPCIRNLFTYDVQTSGIGPDRARQWAKNYLPKSDAHGVLISGFCGGLTVPVHVGDAIFPSRVYLHEKGSEHGKQFHQNADFISAMGRALICAGTRYKSVPLVTINEVVETETQRAQLWDATQTEAVDMESAVIAAECSALGIPFFISKIVSDDYTSDLSGLNEIYQRDQNLSRATMTKWLLEHPVLALKMRKNYGEARERLGPVIVKSCIEIGGLLKAPVVE